MTSCGFAGATSISTSSGTQELMNNEERTMNKDQSRALSAKRIAQKDVVSLSIMCSLFIC